MRRAARDLHVTRSFCKTTVSGGGMLVMRRAARDLHVTRSFCKTTVPGGGMLVIWRAARNSRGAAVVGTRTTSSANSSAWPDVGHNLKVGNLGNIFVKNLYLCC
jgi:hypothetical protein